MEKVGTQIDIHILSPQQHYSPEWKQPMHLSTDEKIKKIYVDTMGYYSAM